MKIKRTKAFKKMFEKLRLNEKKRILSALKLFQKNPFDELLKNHALSGKMEGKRAFSAGGNLRIIFEEKDNYVHVLFLAVGTHNQVY